jgi:hypothetical protein
MKIKTIECHNDDCWFWLPAIFHYVETDEIEIDRYGFSNFYSLSWFCFVIEVEVL